MSNAQEVEDIIHRAGYEIKNIILDLTKMVENFPEMTFLVQEYPENNPWLKRTNSYEVKKPGIVIAERKHMNTELILTREGLMQYLMEHNLPLLNFSEHKPINYIAHGMIAIEYLEELIRKEEAEKAGERIIVTTGQFLAIRDLAIKL